MRGTVILAVLVATALARPDYMTQRKLKKDQRILLREVLSMLHGIERRQDTEENKVANTATESPSTDCYPHGFPGGYKGSTAVTEDGTQCVPWNSQYYTTKYPLMTADKFADNVIPGAVCRDVNRRKGLTEKALWCFIDMEGSWGRCSQIPECPAPPISHECGMLPRGGIQELTKRIVGGAEATAHNWPSICSLNYGTAMHSCGGTLVKNKQGRFYIVSAAHCFFTNGKPDDADQWEARCGAHNLAEGPWPHEQRFSINAIMNHEKYDDGDYHFDIAVLSLDHQPLEDDYVQAACLADHDHTAGERALVAGWGRLETGGSSPDVLHEIYVKIKSDDYCEEAYGDPNFTDEHVSFCAGHPEGGKDSCQGDSGGPLYTDRDGRWTLTGVVSWGKGCGVKEYPGIYADVGRLRSWIDEKIKH